MADRCRVDGRTASSVPGDDRGLAYGDGVFRTLLLSRGCPLAWAFQWQRLDADCQALGIETPAESALLDDLVQVGADLEQAVAKIMVTRGSGQRGYAPDPQAVSRRIVSAHPRSDSGQPESLALDPSDIFLTGQPRLAGVKHMNRLDQVLARAACRKCNAADAVMCDSSGFIISTTMRNLVFSDARGRWWTPGLRRAGVMGATRQRLLWSRSLQGSPIQVKDIVWDDIPTFTAAIACNSVGGACPVVRMGAHDLPASHTMAESANLLLAQTE